MFQFLIGSIIAKRLLSGRESKNQFQFLIGSIIAVTNTSPARIKWYVSIPDRFDYSPRYGRNRYTSFRSFNS